MATFWLRLLSTRDSDTHIWGLGQNTATSVAGYALWSNAPGRLDLWGPGIQMITGPTLILDTWVWISLVGHTGASQSWTLTVDGTPYNGTSPGGGGYSAGPAQLLGSIENFNYWAHASMAAYKHWSVPPAAAAPERQMYMPRTAANLWCLAPLLHTGNLQDLSRQANHLTAQGTPTTALGPPLAWDLRPKSRGVWTTTVVRPSRPQVQLQARQAGIL
jgi:hypothetical protein